MTNNLVSVPPLSETFGKIEYELQLQLNAPRLTISECYELANPHISAQFKAFCKTMSPQNIVDVFVPTSKLQQPVSEISQKGIKVDTKNGFTITVGTFDVNRNADMIEVVRLSVALGNTLNYQQSFSADPNECGFIEEPPTAASLKAGYHSLCTSTSGTYVVFNQAQILTCNLVRFAGGDVLSEVKPDDDTCDLCGKEKATIWCINDSAKLCPACDEESHQGKISRNHRRVPLTEARSMIEFCPVHSDQRVEYYCPQCQCPVCYKCKMTGSHSKGNAATHPLIEIKTAYNEAIEASSHEDPIFARRRSAIHEKIQQAEAKLEAIHNNEEEVEQEIMRLATIAIRRLKELSGEKALIVRSAKTELERKEAELETLAKFISIHKSSSGPLAFLRSFDRHAMLVSSMQETNDLPADIKVEADLTVFGNVDVGSTEKQSLIGTGDKTGSPQSRLKSQDSPKKTGSPQSKSKSGKIKAFQASVNEIQSTTEPDEDDSYATFAENDNYQDSPKKPSSPPQQHQHQHQPRDSPPKKSRNSSLKRKSDSGPEYTSLVALAQRREQKNKARGMELTFQPFSGTQIIDKASQCTALYLCFPFKAQPQTHLLFSTERDGRSIQKMHQMIDGIGITAVLIKKGDFIFGGFAAAKWNSDGEPFGEGSSSFLFSVSQDAFIPYKPRTQDACHLFATEDTLTFGKFDLVLADNFDQCSAQIEYSYGIGFQQGSTEAQTFLAGQPVFRADIVEVWGFFTIEQQ